MERDKLSHRYFKNQHNQIVKILIYTGLSQAEFAELIGTTQQYISSLKTGKSNLGINIANRIEKHFPEINKYWLLTGEGEMIKSGMLSDAEISGDYPNISLVSNKGVPYYDIDFVGGHDFMMSNLTLKPSFYINFLYFNDADFWMNVTGKSMSPFISHGDICAFKKLPDWENSILYGEIYAIVTKDIKTIKILGQGKDDNYLNIIPNNKNREFSDQQIPKNKITHIYKIIGSMKKFF